MPIRLLPEHVATQIAAGEVIERPASVIKELIENALDAGARAIEVDVSGSGVGAMRVSDNGHGIPAEEMELALTRHATSKIASITDLDHIMTLGFRGEALASIVSVARVTLASRHIDAPTGMRMVAEGGRILEQKQVGIPAGTTLEIENLFYNVPARRKFLKSETTERRHIANLVMRYAMAYPAVRFALYGEGKEAFRTSGNGDLADVLVDTLGLEVFRDMVEVFPLERQRPDLPLIEVYGFTSAPSQTRANRGQITLFVNGRSIQDQRLGYAVTQAYHTLIPQGRYPVTVLMINLPPEEVDVNVHPTKAEVRFRNPDAVFSIVQRAVRQAVLHMSDAPTLHAIHYRPDTTTYTEADSQDEGTPERYTPTYDIIAPEIPLSPSPARVAPRTIDSRQLDMEMDIADRGRRGQQIPNPAARQAEQRRREEEEQALLQNIPEGAGKPRRPRSLPMLRVVGQIAAAYIVAEGPAGMYLIDQHAAHERIMYEEFMARFLNQEKFVQHTLESVVVQVSPMEARAVEEALPALTRVGFQIEAFGTNTYRLRAVPAVLADHDPADVLHRVLSDMDGDAPNPDDPGGRTIEEKIVRRVCKTAAVKAGQVLSYDEMGGLIRQLERCENPHTCPHGRPTMIHMSATDLAREFGRLG